MEWFTNIKTLIEIAVVIGVIFVAAHFFKFWNSAAGNAIKSVLGAAEAVAEALAAALDSIVGDFNECFQGKSSNKKSISTGKQAISCLKFTGIIVGMVLGVAVLGGAYRWIKKKFSPESELLKEAKEKVVENIKKISESDEYKNAVENVKKALQDKDEKLGDEEAQSQAEQLVEARVQTLSAKTFAKTAADAAKKTKNEQDAEFQERMEQKADAKAAEERTLLDNLDDNVREDVEEELNNANDDLNNELSNDVDT